MAIVTVQERWSGGECTAESDDGRSGSIETRRSFVVVVDNSPAVDTEADVLAAAGIPRVRNPHPLMSYLRCRSVRVRRASPVLWEVSCDYRAPTYSFDKNPLLEPAKISWRDLESEEEVDVDADGDAITTVNGEPVAGLTRPINDLELVVVRNQVDYNAFAYAAFANRTNSAPFFGFPAGAVLCKAPTAESVSDEDFQYWTVTFRFIFRVPLTDDVDPDKVWYHRFRHEGYLEKSGSDIVRALDDSGEPMPVPVLLDATGERETDPANAVWLFKKKFKSADFGLLAIY